MDLHQQIEPRNTNPKYTCQNKLIYQKIFRYRSKFFVYLEFLWWNITIKIKPETCFPLCIFYTFRYKKSKLLHFYRFRLMLNINQQTECITPSKSHRPAVKSIIPALTATLKRCTHHRINMLLRPFVFSTCFILLRVADRWEAEGWPNHHREGRSKLQGHVPSFHG